MITVWRLEKARHAPEAFSGEGARRVSGRWHHRGTAVVYASESLALSVLEKFVHLGFGGSRIAFVYFRIDIPGALSIEEVKVSHLPRNWTESPPPDETKNIGTDWAKTGRTAVLKVPSVLIPGNCNFLLNPAHRDFRKMRISKPIVFAFDERMWEKKLRRTAKAE